MFDFAYKLQLHCNIYKLVFTIWTIKTIEMKIPLGSCKLYAKRNIPIIFCKYLQKIIAQCNCKYCFKIRIIYIIMMYIALVKASINGNSIRNTFTDCIPILLKKINGTG